MSAFDFPQHLQQFVGGGSVSERAVDNGLHVSLAVNDKIVECHSLCAVDFRRFLVPIKGQRESGLCPVLDLLQSIHAGLLFTKHEYHFGVQRLEIVGLFLQLNQLPHAVRSPVRPTEHQGDVPVAGLQLVRQFERLAIDPGHSEVRCRLSDLYDRRLVRKYGCGESNRGECEYTSGEHLSEPSCEHGELKYPETFYECIWAADSWAADSQRNHKTRGKHAGIAARSLAFTTSIDLDEGECPARPDIAAAYAALRSFFPATFLRRYSIALPCLPHASMNSIFLKQ